MDEPNNNSLTSESTPLLSPPNDTGEIRYGTTNIGDDSQDVADENSILSEYSNFQIFSIVGSCWLGIFLASADGTAVSTLIAPISDSFNSFTLVSWLASSYYIATSAVQPLSGRLSDIYGRRPGLALANLLFFCGNMVCGLARSEMEMIFGRIVAGLGGGILGPVTSFVISDLVPLRQRGVWQGFGNLFYGIGSSFGGVLAGWINVNWNWRYAFLLQLPMILVSGIWSFVKVKYPLEYRSEGTKGRLDVLGAILLVSSVVMLLLGINCGGSQLPWAHPLVYSSIGASIVFLGIFGVVETKYAIEPILPVRYMLKQTVFAACTTIFFATLALFALLFYAPIYFQILGFNSSQIGTRTLPMALGISIGSLISGVAIRASGTYRWVNYISQASFVTCMFLVMAFFKRGWESIAPVILGATGVSFSSILPVTFLAMISTVCHEDRALITSFSFTFRSIASSIGVAAASGVFQNSLKRGLWRVLGAREGGAKLIEKLRNNIEEIGNLPSEDRELVMDVFMNSLHMVWVLIAGFAVVGAILSLFIRQNKLYSTLNRS